MGFAQPITGYFFRGTPQSLEYNPAMRHDSSRFFIAMPGLSKLDVGVGTNSFTLGDAVQHGSGEQGFYSDSLYFNMDNFYNALSDRNSLDAELSYTYLNFGFKSGKKSFISLGLTTKAAANPYFSKEFVGFLKDGNANHVGTYDLGDNGINALVYSEAALTYTREINKKLSVGASVKALVGHAAIQTERFDASITTAEDLSKMDITVKSEIYASFPGNIEHDDEEGAQYVSGINTDDIEVTESLGDNMGWAFGFGATYKPIKGLELAASVMDLGSIDWKTDSYLFTQEDEGTYSYRGPDLSDIMDDDDETIEDEDNEFEEVLDSMVNSFKVTDKEAGFSTTIPTKIYISGSYDLLGSALNVGAVYRKRIWDDYDDQMLALSANAWVAKFLSLSASYSMMSETENKLGLGFGVRTGALQLYVMSDDVLWANDVADCSGANMRFGINWLFGRKPKE